MIKSTTETKISFKKIDFVKKVAVNKIKANELLTDSFSRKKLASNSSAKNLNGPFGHPYTGRPASSGGTSNTSDKLGDLINDQLNKDIDTDKAEDTVEIGKSIFNFVKEAVKSILDLD